MSDANYDYTKDDAPSGNEADDFLIGGAVAARSADDIEKANAFVDMPAGDHLLVIAGFPKPPEKKYIKVELNGRATSYETHTVEVRLAMPGNPKCSIVDFFQLPPDTPAEQKAYFEGIPEGKKQAGWSASKFIHFVNRLGFRWEPGQPLPDAAKRLGNWKGRAVFVTVDAGKGTYTDKTGVTKPSRNQIRPFSYRVADQAAVQKAKAAQAAVAAGQTGATQVNAGVPSATGSPAQSQVPVGTMAGGSDDGLDNI